MKKVYNWVTLPFSRDWHTIVNQLYFNFFKKSKRRSSGSVNAKEKSILDTGTFVQKPWDFFFFFCLIWGSKQKPGEFPGGPVVRTPQSHCQGPRFDPWLKNSGSESHMAWPKKKKPSVAEAIRGGYQPEDRGSSQSHGILQWGGGVAQPDLHLEFTWITVLNPMEEGSLSPVPSLAEMVGNLD